jgi:S1-C subfamily serine protease
MGTLPPLTPNPEPPEPPRTRGKSLATAILAAAVAAGVAFGVARLGDDGSATRTVTVVERSGSTTTTTAAPRTSDPALANTDGDGLSVQQIVRDASPSVVLVQHSGGLGSGFLIDAKGRILTNAHVVEGASDVTVTYADGTTQSANVLASDPAIDLAVLDVSTPPPSAKPLPFGESRRLVVGDPVVAIGNPLGLERTATTGIVSALKRQICSPDDSPIPNAIQTDAAINQGNSGGPLLDSRGRVIGINSQIASQGGGFEGIGFAVPIDAVRPVADAIIANGTAQHAWIGIVGEAVTPDVAKSLGAGDARGVALRKIDERGPSKAAGLRASSAPDDQPPKGGDIIVEIAGQPVRDFGDLSQEVSSRRVGDTVNVTVLRDGKRVTLKLTLADRPANLRGTCQ